MGLISGGFKIAFLDEIAKLMAIVFLCAAKLLEYGHIPIPAATKPFDTFVNIKAG